MWAHGARRPAVWAIALAVAVAGCTARRPAAVTPVEPSPVADLDRARVLVAAGCYECLVEALDLYSAVYTRRPTDLPALAADGVLTTSLVLAIRERQLGMIDHGYIDGARRMVSVTSDPVSAGVLVDVADTIPWAPSARARDDTFNPERYRAINANRATWRQTLQALASPVNLSVRYIAAAFDCAWPERGAAPDTSAAFTDITEPLLIFANNICRGTSADPFIGLLQREPRFVEAEYYIGLRALGARKLDESDARLTRALAWHPGWPALTTTLGGVAMTAEDPERALTLYDRTLAMIPRQQDARLGRLTALSYLGRFDEAVSTADGLIEDGHWFVGDALYWRAWNKTQLAQIEEAWSDVQRAMTLLLDDKTPKLAGIIAVKRLRFQEAQALFEEARKRNPADCGTAFYLAAVHAQLRHWPPSAAIFGEAVTCFEGTAAGLRAEIAQLEASDAAPDRKQRVIAKRTQQMTDAIKEAGTSCYNAAVGYLNSAKKEEARGYAQRAATFEEYKDRMGELLARIEKLK